MRFHFRPAASAALLFALPFCTFAVLGAPRASRPLPRAKPAAKKMGSIAGGTIESRIRAQMQALAGDAMQGRGSGTPDELRAGQYIASQLQNLGVQPAGSKGAGGKSSFMQAVDLGQGRRTWNVLGVLPAREPKGAQEVILLSAHMDHLGVDPELPGADKIYNGADDDASGCVAVLELARALAVGPRSRRSVYFAFFGSEELGGLGARYFLAHLPFPQSRLIANLEFEMIGRADSAVAPDQLWLTGFERSSLGPQLARQGAHLVADPHPEENFFMRSDNFVLARQGVVAHTVSSFGLHRDYHQPSDEIAQIDFKHMARAIASMQKPVRWLAGSTFKPTWNEGMRP